MTTTDPAVDRLGLCDHCDNPQTGGAAGGGEPPEHWCDDHNPFNDPDYVWPDREDDPAERYAAALAPYNRLTDWARTLPTGHRGGFPTQADHLYDATLITLLSLLHRVTPEDAEAATAEARDFMERQTARRIDAGRVTA